MSSENTQNCSGKVRVRFAPSPTGFLHIGNVRAAIFNWLLARHYGGTYLVRIEDTDRSRFKQEYVDVILTSLKWLGIESDEEPVIQSRRADAHKSVAQKLLAQGKAYPCFCSTEDLDELKKSAGHGFKYSGTCRNKSWTQKDLERPHAIRFKIPENCSSVSYHDLIRGDVCVGRDQLDDFVIVRSGGMAIYNFCVVVDDSFMGITHVIRGEDHISNTPKQKLIYEALGYQAPQFAHLPMILGPSGEKLSKRHGAISAEDCRAAGFLPEALFNYLVRLGWSHGDQEVFERDELVKVFSLDAVGKSGAVYDIKKLEWFNGVHMRQKSVEDLIHYIEQMDSAILSKIRELWSEVQLDGLIPLYRDRASTLKNIADALVSLASAPKDLDISLLKKWIVVQTSGLLREFSSKFADCGNSEDLLNLAKNICVEHSVKLVSLAQALRLAITGGTQSPGIFEIIALLDPSDLKKRILFLVEKLECESTDNLTSEE